jgi:hypothetical protein
MDFETFKLNNRLKRLERKIYERSVGRGGGLSKALQCSLIVILINNFCTVEDLISSTVFLYLFLHIVINLL